jgi:CBS domain-containing protein
LCCADPDPGVARVPSIADQIPVTQIMSREIQCARRDLSAERVVELMVQNRIGCVPVVEDPGRPIGMITKLDVVEQMLAGDRGEPEVPPARNLTPRTANELMMPIAITIGERATVAHAAALMASEDVHHVPIVDARGRMIGIVSTMDIVRWLARNDGFGH